jgi:hypothetical protein
VDQSVINTRGYSIYSKLVKSLMPLSKTGKGVLEEIAGQTVINNTL